MTSATRGQGDGSEPYDYKKHERRQRVRTSGFPLQLNITSVFALILVTTIVSVVAFAYYKNTSSVLDLTERFMARVAEGCIGDSVAMFKPVTEAVKTTAVFAAQTEDATRSGAIFPYFRTVLQNNPQVQSIYVGYQADGRFLQGYAGPPHAAKFGPNDAPPPSGAAFAYRVVDRGNGGYVDRWTYVDQDGRVLGSESSTKTNYDPRLRPFYGDAVKADKLILTDLLVYASNRQPGVTAPRWAFDRGGGGQCVHQPIVRFHGPLGFGAGRRGPDRGRSPARGGLSRCQPDGASGRKHAEFDHGIGFGG